MVETVQARDELRCQAGDQDDLNYHCLHWRFVPATVPVDVGQDKVEGKILDEVPEEESDVDSFFQKVGQH